MAVRGGVQGAVWNVRDGGLASIDLRATPREAQQPGAEAGSWQLLLRAGARAYGTGRCTLDRMLGTSLVGTGASTCGAVCWTLAARGNTS